MAFTLPATAATAFTTSTCCSKGLACTCSVGPRPLLSRYLPRYTQRQARRHEVRPGITGWAQVRGRNALNWEERLEHDVWYVDHVSPMLDAKILLLTVRVVLSGRGVTAADHATMPEFKGSRE